MRLDIRSQGLQSSHASTIERRLRFVLGRFGTRVGRVRVLLADLSREHPDTVIRCQIVARLTPTGEVCVDVTESDLHVAWNRAVDRIGPAISRELKRRRDARGYRLR